MIKSVLIKNLKALRKLKGWNQEDLAEATGYSAGFIADVERGKSWVSPESLEKFCEALGVPCERLFSSDEQGILFEMPMSQTLKKLMVIPDEIYEKAQGIPPGHKVWGTVADALDLAHESLKIKSIKKTNGN